MHGGKRAQISAPKLTSRHSDRGGFHGSDHTIQGGDLDRDLSALRTERARGKLPAVETLDAANAGFNRTRPRLHDCCLHVTWHSPFGTPPVRLLTQVWSCNSVPAPIRGSRAVFGLAEHVMLAIWLQPTKSPRVELCCGKPQPRFKAGGGAGGKRQCQK